MEKIKVKDSVGAVLIHDMTQIISGVTKGPRFRKGHVIQAEDFPPSICSLRACLPENACRALTFDHKEKNLSQDKNPVIFHYSLFLYIKRHHDFRTMSCIELYNVPN